MTGLLVAKKEKIPADFPAARQLPPDATLLKVIEAQAKPPAPPSQGEQPAASRRRIKPKQLPLPFADRDGEDSGQGR